MHPSVKKNMEKIDDPQHVSMVSKCILDNLGDGIVVCVTDRPGQRAESIRDAVSQARPDIKVTILDRDWIVSWTDSQVVIADADTLSLMDYEGISVCAICIATRPVMSDHQAEAFSRLLDHDPKKAPKLIGPYRLYTNYVRSCVATHRRLQRMDSTRE